MTLGPATSVLLCSGGLDSTTLAYWLLSQGIRFVPVFVNYGQHCAKTELTFLRSVLPTDAEHQVVTIDVSDVYAGSNSAMISEVDLWQAPMAADDLYLPYRNVMLLSIGAAFAQSNGLQTVYAAFINSNHAKEIDCSAIFFERLGELLSDYGSARIEMPFRNMSKLQVAELGLSLGAPIAHTFSCQVSARVPCGVCPNCVDRLEALRALPSL